MIHRILITIVATASSRLPLKGSKPTQVTTHPSFLSPRRLSPHVVLQTEFLSALVLAVSLHTSIHTTQLHPHSCTPLPSHLCR